MTATGINKYSITPASNNSVSPNGFPVGMPPSGVGGSARQIMAEIRRWYEDPSWIDYGYTYAYVSGTSFKVSASDVTANFVVGRRVRIVGTTTGTIYGSIATSVFSTDTTVTITLDSGTVQNETLAVSIGSPHLGFPQTVKRIFRGESTIASATTTDLSSGTSDVVAVSGTTTITSFGSNASINAPLYFVRFTGAMLLTYNASSLILPSAANITTAAGDTAVMKYEGSGNWRCLFYQTASGIPLAGTTTDATLSTSDITTNNVSTSKHGFQKKLPNDATLYADGTGNYSKPASGLTLGTPTAFNSAATYNVTSLPAGIKQLTMNLQGVTMSGSASEQVSLF